MQRSQWLLFFELRQVLGSKPPQSDAARCDGQEHLLGLVLVLDYAEDLSLPSSVTYSEDFTCLLFSLL